MTQFNKRGNRVRASDKSLVFRFSAGSLLLLFFVVVLLLNLSLPVSVQTQNISVTESVTSSTSVSHWGVCRSLAIP